MEGAPASAQSPLLLSILRRRKRIVFGVAALVLLATVVLTMRETPIYAATAAVVVETPRSEAPTASPNMATEAQVARSLAVARIVADDLDLDIAPTRLVADLSVDVPVDSDVLKFTYSNPQPEVAQTRAQSFAEAYLALRREQLERQRVASRESIENRIESLAATLSVLRARIRSESSTTSVQVLQAQADAVATQIGTLQQKLAEVNGYDTTSSGGAVLGDVVLPESPTRPNMTLNALVALFVGLLLGIAVAAAREYTDDRIRDEKDVEARLGAPVFASIPTARPKRGAPRAPPLIMLGESRSSRAEAFRRLRTNFLSAANDAGVRSVLVARGDANESETAVGVNLAVALAATGKQVVLVSADLRRASLEEAFGATVGPGFADVLLDAGSVTEALRDSGIENLRLLEGASPLDGLAASSGSTLSGAAELLGSDRAARAIEELEQLADFVVIEAPPLLAAVDSAALARFCDAVLIVADGGRTTRRDLVQAREELDSVRTTVLGAVLLDREQRRSDTARLGGQEMEIETRVTPSDNRQGKRAELTEPAMRRQEATS